MKSVKTKTTATITLCAMFAALTACFSQISVPIGPVPLSLSHIAVFLAAGLLSAKYGAASQVVYVLVGLFGAPVFAGFKGGMGVVLGPTGGFLAGYILCALITGLLADKFGKNIPMLMLCMYAGWFATYLCGIPWYMHMMKSGFVKAASECFLPFIPGDLIKTIISAFLVNKLRPMVRAKYI
ncbi:MAG: biotin transporter BioY [Eubacterium sp.]|jgi:biotin transport system substrate-specific component|nr:biotin transporter BioY [Eubacterium sp.]